MKPPRAFTLLRCSCAFLLGFAQNLAAQAGTDAVTATRAHYHAGTPSSRAASDLKLVYRQSATAATATMKVAGYGAVAIATALKTEYAATANQAYDALASSGFSAKAVSDALAQAGIPVPRDCIDQQNNVVPCGTFGGMPNTPVMGQVKWTPMAQGNTDALLTVTGTNIPAVTIRVGNTTLTGMSATSAQVVVRLPHAAVTGPLVMRRTSDGVEGTMEGSYKVVVAQVDWDALAIGAMAGAVADARRWLSGARIAAGKCVVAGPLAVGPVGAVSTTTDVSAQVRAALLSAGASPPVASNWDAAFSAAWHDWANNLSIPYLPWWPGFATWAAASAPATANVATPLGLLTSSGTLGLTPPALASRIQFALGTDASSAAAQTAVSSFATAFAVRFAQFMTTGMVANVKGSGTVPTYDPPQSPFGPVSGICSGSGVVSNANSF